MKKHTDIIIAIISFLIAAGVFTIAIVVSTVRPLSDLENILFQVFCLLFSSTATFFLGKIVSSRKGLEEIQPLARSAFRRVLTLFRSLSRMAFQIDASKKAVEKNSNCALDKLKTLEAIVVEEIDTVDDALHDWQDIIPKEVAAVIHDIKGEGENAGKN